MMGKYFKDSFGTTRTNADFLLNQINFSKHKTETTVIFSTDIKPEIFLYKMQFLKYGTKIIILRSRT